MQPKNLWGTANRDFGSISPMDRQEIDPIEFGKRVRARRIELGLSQAELAKSSRQSQSNIGWIEQGKAKKPAKQVLPLVEALRTSTDWLLYGSGEKETGLRLLADHEVAEIYRDLGFEQRAEVSETFSKLAKSLKKGRKVG
jgi:transcriptional regulator with XRE-family HTH domain